MRTWSRPAAGILFWLLFAAVIVAQVAIVAPEFWLTRLWEDEAFNLTVPLNLIAGHGYSSAGLLSTGTTAPFDVRISTGPVLLLPVAAVLTTGIDPVIGGRLVSLLFYAGLLVALWILGRRIGGRWAALIAVVVPLTLNTNQLPSPVQGPIDILGEFPAAALIAWSFVFARRRPWLAGLFLGLAIQTKFIGLLSAPALLVLVWFVVAAAPWRARLKRCIWFTVWAVVPTALYWLAVLVSLGPAGFVDNAHQFLAFLKSGGQTASVPLDQKLTGLMGSWFVESPIAIAVVVAAVVIGVLVVVVVRVTAKRGGDAAAARGGAGAEAATRGAGVDADAPLTDAGSSADAQLTDARTDADAPHTDAGSSADAQLTDARTDADAQLTDAVSSADAQLTDARSDAGAPLTDAGSSAEAQLTDACTDAGAPLTDVGSSTSTHELTWLVIAAAINLVAWVGWWTLSRGTPLWIRYPATGLVVSVPLFAAAAVLGVRLLWVSALPSRVASFLRPEPAVPAPEPVDGPTDVSRSEPYGLRPESVVPRLRPVDGPTDVSRSEPYSPRPESVVPRLRPVDGPTDVSRSEPYGPRPESAVPAPEPVDGPTPLSPQVPLHSERAQEPTRRLRIVSTLAAVVASVLLAVIVASTGVSVQRHVQATQYPDYGETLGQQRDVARQLAGLGYPKLASPWGSQLGAMLLSGAALTNLAGPNAHSLPTVLWTPDFTDAAQAAFAESIDAACARDVVRLTPQYAVCRLR